MAKLLSLLKVVSRARMGPRLAPDWSRANGWRHMISGVGNRWPGDKKDRGLIGNRKSRDLKGETAD